ncbi:uncharacterized protein ACA1_114600 [Acanthamoeba castellanii str. Neff]|uniref:Uncharacterized protein n=1 Tax=Acanthamoeba castellanii (strain ATCC 30010 / Neff) TaxID=1257118 RepID=L8H4J0_ACACF|nr:uncharacterized protein ACA1_114600 [Acanthamoeba castellanii str. Neff]ELR20080.1 hypothetical protein ACA1_114600 [Acanthamoeba castellanii str. Neff]
MKGGELRGQWWVANQDPLGHGVLEMLVGSLCNGLPQFVDLLLGIYGVKWLAWLIIAAIAILIIFSATVGIVFGILHQTPQHIMLTGSMLCLVLVLIVQWRFYAKGDQDPKLFWVLLGSTLVVVLMCVTINAYVWPPLPADPNGLYNTQTKLCVLSGVANCYATGQCPQVTSLEQPVAQCCNCTCGATPMGLDAFGRAL